MIDAATPLQRGGIAMQCDTFAQRSVGCLDGLTRGSTSSQPPTKVPPASLQICGSGAILIENTWWPVLTESVQPPQSVTVQRKSGVSQGTIAALTAWLGTAVAEALLDDVVTQRPEGLVVADADDLIAGAPRAGHGLH